MAKKKVADVLLKSLTNLRDALRDGSIKNWKITILARCDKCKKIFPLKELRGGWCKSCEGN